MSVQTDLGGIFYLITMALALELYGDFTKPLEPGLPLSIWDFLALVGGALLAEPGCAWQAPQDDRVWHLLASLGGRRLSDRPGAGFRAPDAWRMPPSWLTPFPKPGPWRCVVAQGRLRVQHPAGFPVLDLPLDPLHPTAQLRRELEPYGVRPRSLKLAVERGNENGRRKATAGRATLRFLSSKGRLGRWLSWLLPYVRARLRRALALSPGDDVASLLLCHAARVFVTPTRVDIALSLDRLPVAIRLSGLDRDPGWVPAAGRFIAFHFD